MTRRLCTLSDDPLSGRLIGYATGGEFGYEARPLSSFDAARRAAKECDVLLFREFGKNRARLVRELTRKNPSLDVLVLAGEGSPGPMPYYEAGAAGYVGPDASEDEILEHLRANHAGETLVDPMTARRLVRRLADLSRALGEREFDPERCDDLTGREREICTLLSEGASNHSIGDSLGIAGGTVKSHLHNIYRKLDVESRHVAAALWRIWCENRGDEEGAGEEKAGR